MPTDETHEAGPSTVPESPSNSNHDASSGRFLPSAKLREKLSKLADRRIDITSIEFPHDARKFSGASATVSHAFWVPPSGAENTTGQTNPTETKGLNVPGRAGEASPQRKPVAVKKMKISGDPARVLGLTLREAEFLVGLSHENVIKLEGFVEDLPKDVVWLVFPWEGNGTLKDFIASSEWEIPERIWLISDVAEGVEYLHGRQPPIRHGDLKSINILVNSEYRAVITDFGSARHQTTEDPDSKETSQPGNEPQPALSLEATSYGPANTLCITLTGDHFTLRWAAPELLNEEKATLACDIWALGFVMYEVMTNSIPFQDVINDNAVIVRVVKGDLPSITDNARMLLIQALCSLMLACWSIDPEKRPTAGTCQKSINWMPMIKPSPMRTADAAASRARSPALLMQLGEMYLRQGDSLYASDLYTKALDSYNEIGDNKGKAAALVELAQVHRLRDENDKAVASYSEALQIHADIGDRQGRAFALWGLADVHRLRNEYSQAITFYSEALDIHTDIDNRQGRADALWGLADVHRLRGEYSQAIIFYSKVIDIRTDTGDTRGRAFALNGLADVHRLRNEYSQAITFYSEALHIRTDIGDRQGRADTLEGLADLHQVRGEYSPAITFYSEALDIRTDIGDRKGRASALQRLAEVHRLRNEYNQAITFYSEALYIYIDIGDRAGRAFTLQSLARVHGSQNEYGQAITLFSEALEISTDIGDRFGRAYALLGLADAHRDQGNYGDAIGPYTEAAEVFEQIAETQNAAYASDQAADVRQLYLGEEAT